jgi:sterol desaturase/sphingolipid hydroxylase (fatty acid hydroxylase superfamily)
VHPVITTVVETFLAAMLAAALWIVAGGAIERWAPACPSTEPNLFFNLACFAPAALLSAAVGPVVAATTIAVVNACGGGWITLSAAGWAIVPGVAVYLFVMDFGEYLFHRAQHRLPMLWAMHSLHHSDRDFNVSTTVRHFWLEHLIKGVTIYPVVAILFRPDPVVVVIYGVLSTYNYFAHLNCRIGFGRWAWLLNSPQLHRIHHSALLEHRDRNFAALLPVFDVVFGAFTRPGPNEYPETGLGGREAAPSWAEAFTWPVRATRQPEAV